jgi:nucleoside permease NupC
LAIVALAVVIGIAVLASRRVDNVLSVVKKIIAKITVQIVIRIHVLTFRACAERKKQSRHAQKKDRRRTNFHKECSFEKFYNYMK